ncbi:MAG TPA: hypothetical protein PKY05_10655, partial [Fibrobacteria bacterium]|nr:hypothetical protein [Fibrobacteria bacterium]
ADDAQTAQSIRNFLACAFFESTRDERTDPLATASRKGLLLSFRPHENIHPTLVEHGYGLANILSALGVWAGTKVCKAHETGASTPNTTDKK